MIRFVGWAHAARSSVPLSLAALMMMAAVLLLIAMIPPAAQARETPLVVVATTPVLEDMVMQIGGGRVATSCLVEGGGDIHDIELTPDDMRRLRAADVLVLNGLGLELSLEAALSNSGFAGTVIVASEGITPLKLREPCTHGHGGTVHHHDTHVTDPHAWMNVANALIYAQNIRDGLVLADPQGEADYRAWGDLYIAQLNALHSWVRREVARIPAERRMFAVDHDSLHYFCVAYGMESFSLLGGAEHAEPPPSDMARMAGMVTGTPSRTVFYVHEPNRQTMERVASEAGGRVGGQLLSDVGPHADDSNRGLYIDMVRHNVRLLARALQ